MVMVRSYSAEDSVVAAILFHCLLRLTPGQAATASCHPGTLLEPRRITRSRPFSACAWVNPGDQVRIDTVLNHALVPSCKMLREDRD